MIGDSRMKKIVSDTTLARKRSVPPNARRSSGRVSTSSTVAIFGANHITRMMTISQEPIAGSMKSAGVGANATASVPTTSMPIQAGEPRNISMAKASWKRLTIFMPGWNRKWPYCSVPWVQRWSRRRYSISVGGFSSQPRSSSGSTRTS